MVSLDFMESTAIEDPLFLFKNQQLAQIACLKHESNPWLPGDNPKVFELVNIQSS